MNGKIRTHYRGWDISVRCLTTRAEHDTAPFPAYTATAVAVLRNPAEADDWIDSRIQRSTLTDRVFDTTANCAAALLAEVKILIDSIRRHPPSRA
ncbi:MAG: hypothetical protein V4723_09105 [Pseudomonadota bacterium]